MLSFSIHLFLGIISNAVYSEGHSYAFTTNTAMFQLNLIKTKLRSPKSNEHIYEKGDGPYRGFDYLSLFSDHIDLATWSQRQLV